MAAAATTVFAIHGVLTEKAHSKEENSGAQCGTGGHWVIARDAEVQVLGRHGFETAVKGKNGFVCIVARSWTSVPDPDFWNPKVRVPRCLNAPAARSYLPHLTKETEWELAGRTKAQTDESIAAAVDKKELPAMELGAMCYMMSKQGYGGDSVKHWPPHLMFYYPQTDPATWGANLPGSPIFASSQTSEHLSEFVIAGATVVGRNGRSLSPKLNKIKGDQER